MISSEKTDPLELARDEYRKLLTRMRAAESDRDYFRRVIESATCVAMGDGSPEIIGTHPLVALVSDQLRLPTELRSANMRLLALLRDVLKVYGTPRDQSGGVRDQQGESRLLEQIRGALSAKGMV